ncbi:BMC domain-containing protein [Iocasia frigidifontis]|uniref:BMC domain-containing protein n=1 Tax=Iocasia fonsfrigidae TaxID=2682810 RepID=A0A8A7KAK6_9FIRM|nr:BMC domain-containing protein [Iocasia fonsfrigidae]QTL98806.1 BMC domain-containing protein [Iocasia fonsfrigidae]
MLKRTVGLIETVGLSAAIEASDVALKAANIELLGYEISRGGLVTVKITGKVSAVKAAVDAAQIAADRVNSVRSIDVIPRPHDSLKQIIETRETVGLENNAASTKGVLNSVQPTPVLEDNLLEQAKKEVNEDKESGDDEAEIGKTVKVDRENNEKKEIGFENKEIADEEAENEEDQNDQGEICNLCGDPDCPRRKGDLRVNCIHYDEIIGDE